MIFRITAIAADHAIQADRSDLIIYFCSAAAGAQIYAMAIGPRLADGFCRKSRNMLFIVSQCAIDIKKDDLLPHFLSSLFLHQLYHAISRGQKKIRRFFTLRKFWSLLGQLACHLIDDVHDVQAAGITDIGHALLNGAIQLGRVIAHAQVAGGMPAQLILTAALREDQTGGDQLALCVIQAIARVVITEAIGCQPTVDVAARLRRFALLLAHAFSNHR